MSLGRGKAEEVSSEGAPEPRAEIGCEHSEIRTNTLENLARECARQYLKKDCLLIKTAVWNTRIQMCNQKPATNKTYKRNTLKQLSSCLNRTPACGRLSWGRKQIFPFVCGFCFLGR